MEPDIALPGGEPSTEETLGPTGLSALKKLRSECRQLRVRLRQCEAQRATPQVLSWRPATSPSFDLVGLADIRLGDLMIFGLRLFRRHGGHVLSWPMRQPRATGHLVPILQPTPSLDAQVLAAILIAAYPERVEP